MAKRKYWYQVERLRALLSELAAMEQLALPSETKTPAEHDEWMKRHEAIEDKVQKAEIIALQTIPEYVAEVFNQIEDRKYYLLQIGRYSPKATEASEHA